MQTVTIKYLDPNGEVQEVEILRPGGEEANLVTIEVDGKPLAGVEVQGIVAQVFHASRWRQVGVAAVPGIWDEDGVWQTRDDFDVWALMETER